MPEKTRKIFSFVAGEIIRMEKLYLICEKLHTPTKKEFELLEVSGMNFFNDFREVLRDFFPTNLFKLTDKAKDGDEYNMSLKGLVQAIESETDHDIEELTNQLKIISENMNALNVHRMKRTAHFSKQFADSIEAGKGPVLSLTGFREALDVIEDFLNTVIQLFIPDSSMYWKLAPIHSTAVLLGRLAKAKEYDELVEKGEIERGRWQRHLRDND